MSRKTLNRRAPSRRRPLFGPGCQAGRNALEILGVLAIFGMLTAGALMGFSGATAKQQLNAQREAIQAVRVSLKELLLTAHNYANLPTVSVMLSAGLLPDYILNFDGAGLKNQYGGVFEIKEGYDSSNYVIELTGLPRSACIRLATEAWGTSEGFVGIDFDLGTVALPFHTTTLGTLPVSIPDAHDSCAAPDTANALQLYFR